MVARRRVDADLVRRKLVDSRADAARLIDERRVRVNGAIVLKATSMVAPGDAVEVVEPAPRYVGRGAHKLAQALEAFALDVDGLRCLDVGSSTGGFTDCLLQAGASSVVALDVGRAQLHERLRADERVEVREQTDVRSVTSDELGGRFDLTVVDVSFIGLAQIVDALARLAAPAGELVVLIKPQFEAARAEADRGSGVITDPGIWKRTVVDALASAERHGLSVLDVIASPIRGGAGNVEFLAHLRAVGQAEGVVVDEVRLRAVADAAVVTAGELP